MPMVVLMAIGVLVRKAGIVNREENKHFNRMVFVVFFPVMMFSNLYGTDLMEVVEWHIIAYAVGALAVIYLGALLFVTRIEKSPKRSGQHNQNDYRRFIKKTSVTEDGECADHTIYALDQEAVEKESQYEHHGGYGKHRRQAHTLVSAYLKEGLLEIIAYRTHRQRPPPSHRPAPFHSRTVPARLLRCGRTLWR